MTFHKNSFWVQSEQLGKDEFQKQDNKWTKNVLKEIQMTETWMC